MRKCDRRKCETGDLHNFVKDYDMFINNMEKLD